MSKRIRVRFNYFGPFFEKSHIPKILDTSESGLDVQSQREFLSDFFGLPVSCLRADMLERYVESSSKDIYTVVVPHDEQLHERLLKPLRLAKKSYCLGDFLSTIALCGVVAEMLTMILWKISDVKLNERVMTRENQKDLFARNFERLGQDRRTGILKAFGIIDSRQADSFNKIREIRRTYLHLWESKRNEKKDALLLLEKTFQLFKEITGIGLAAGAVKINPKLLHLIEDSEQPEEK